MTTPSPRAWSGVTLENGPAGWGYWIHDCDRVTARSLTIRSDVRYPNNDGLRVTCATP